MVVNSFQSRNTCRLSQFTIPEFGANLENTSLSLRLMLQVHQIARGLSLSLALLAPYPAQFVALSLPSHTPSSWQNDVNGRGGTMTGEERGKREDGTILRGVLVEREGESRLAIEGLTEEVRSEFQIERGGRESIA